MNDAPRTTLPSWPRRLFRFAVGLGVLIAIMQLTPWLVRAIPPLQEYNRVLDETGITPGVLFYNDVAQTRDGEINNRDAIKYGVKHSAR